MQSSDSPRPSRKELMSGRVIDADQRTEQVTGATWWADARAGAALRVRERPAQRGVVLVPGSAPARDDTSWRGRGQVRRGGAARGDKGWRGGTGRRKRRQVGALQKG